MWTILPLVPTMAMLHVGRSAAGACYSNVMCEPLCRWWWLLQ